ncbi:MAG: hypothetical protein AB7O96_13095 [Pseudobdellovibrionaceae bacterium]
MKTLFQLSFLIFGLVSTSACSVYQNSDRKYYEDHALEVRNENARNLGFDCSEKAYLGPQELSLDETLNESTSSLIGIRYQALGPALYWMTMDDSQTPFSVCSQEVESREQAIRLFEKIQNITKKTL